MLSWIDANAAFTCEPVPVNEISAPVAAYPYARTIPVPVSTVSVPTVVDTVTETLSAAPAVTDIPDSVVETPATTVVVLVELAPETAATAGAATITAPASASAAPAATGRHRPRILATVGPPSPVRRPPTYDRGPGKRSPQPDTLCEMSRYAAPKRVGEPCR